MWEGAFLGALTPKFYVALTGTSSLISGLILIFEWWYFRKYGASFIEQMSLAHLGPWLGAPPPAPPTTHAPHAPQDCKVWRNPWALLRGAEYARLWGAARRAPLTYYDMNLSAQEHQAWFSLPAPAGQPAAADERAMARAWREREPAARVAAARRALQARPECAQALLLLAEEDAPTVQAAERALRRAWRAAEAAWRASAAAGGAGGAAARRDACVLAHVKRRAAVCLRRLGRLRDSARLFRELARDAPPALHALALHESLLEVLLEQRAFADAQAALARCEEAGAPPSACLLYTAALLRVRAAPHTAPAAPHAAEAAALDALRRAVEFNPYVPAYLLELRPLTLPPEHVLRRGDSEALAYAFEHLRHWRAAGPPAARLLPAALRVARTAGAGAAACARCADRELLPAHHAPRAARAAPATLPAAAACTALAALALLAHRWPALPALPALSADPRALLRLLADV